MLAMLYTHPDIACTPDELSIAIVEQGMPAPMLCFDNPNTMKAGTRVKNTLPLSKFIFVVRDGRAAVESLLLKDKDVPGIDCSVYVVCMIAWNRNINRMYKECQRLGEETCMVVHYELLVLQPSESINNILSFLNLPWTPATLRHVQSVQHRNEARISKLEYYSNRTIKPVNPDSLSSWVGNVPENVKENMAAVAPMLAELGYEPYQQPPDYTKINMAQATH